MAWTEYQLRALGPVYLERDRPTTLTLPLCSAGALAAPSSGTITIYDGSNTAIVNAAAVTITSSIATYVLLAATVSTKTLGVGWRVEWTLTMPDACEHVYRQTASLVRCRLGPVVTDADLLARHTDLASYRPSGQSSWQQYVEEGWREVVSRLEGMGRRPYLVLSPEALRQVHLYETLTLICRDLAGAGDPQNRWTALSETYRREAEGAWGRLALVYDEDDDGHDDAIHRRPGVSSLWLTGRP